MEVKGFTLVELLVVIGIIAIVTGSGLAGWSRFREKSLINSVNAKLKTQLRLVRARAINGDKPTTGCQVLDGYQVREASGNDLEVIACCDGCCQSGSCSGAVEVIQIDEAISATFNNFPVMFLTLSGAADHTASIELVYFDQTRTITISSSGEID